MNYREFRTAAHRHLVCCQKLCNSLTSISNLGEKKAIIDDIYYLSGYIIETLISHAIFSMEDNQTKKNPVNEYPYYEKGFKTHNFQAKIDFAIKHGCSFNGFLLIDQKHPNEKNMKLYNGWSVDLRYQKTATMHNIPDISEKMITDYIEVLSIVEKQFITRFL